MLTIRLSGSGTNKLLSAVERVMTDDPDTLRTYLDRLTELADLALIAPPEDHARMERSIQLVSWALQAVTQARQQSLDEARQKEAADIAALCRRIVGG
jgi:hypothetical protein